MLGINQTIVKDLIAAHEPISKEDLLVLVRNQEHHINNLGKVLKSLTDNDVIECQNGLYVIKTTGATQPQNVRRPNPRRTSHRAGTPHRKPYNYARMVNSGNHGRFPRVRRELGLATATSNGVDLNMDYLVLLTKENANKVNAAIASDPKYPNYMEMVFNHFKTINGGAFPRYDKRAVYALIRIIDYENSTDVIVHNNEAFNNIIDFITEAPTPGNTDNDFWTKLSARDITLVQVLIDCAVTGNKPYSLASKICKYVYKFVFGIHGLFDGYYINDLFVRQVVPAYYNFYCGRRINNPNRANYPQLCSYLEEIHNEVNTIARSTGKPEIDKDELDHIMWYCYKNSL